MSTKISCILVLFFGCVVFANFNFAQTTIDFDELTPPDQGNGDFYFDGYGADATSSSWVSREVVFNTNMFGPGWSYSRVNDTETAGFTNQWAAITGVDISGNGNYVLANSLIDDGAIINLPSKKAVESVFITNSTYSFLSMLKGDGFAKMFGGESGDDPDFFAVTFRGFDEFDAGGFVTGEVEFYLADFRFVDNQLDYIVDGWVPLDLSRLGAARSIGISFSSSDVGKFGINTPAYVAIDELRLFGNVLLGDINQDGKVNLLDVQPFVKLVTSGVFVAEGDFNFDGVVDLLDVEPFVNAIQN